MFDKSFWQLASFLGSWDVILCQTYVVSPEVITKRVKRLGQVYTKGKYVQFTKYCTGYYVCEAGDGLKMKIKKLK